MENTKKKKALVVAALVALALAFYVGFFFLVINR
jgi:hypothetical protein